MVAAGLMMAISFCIPYWQVELRTPNHPEGLRLSAYAGHLEGAPRGGGLERLEASQQVGAAIVLALLVLAAIFAHHRWALLLGLPAMGFPLAVFADLAGWLPAALCEWGERLFGCSGRTLPFWGQLEIEGQSLAARPGGGLVLAVAAALTLAAALWLGVGFGSRSANTTKD